MLLVPCYCHSKLSNNVPYKLSWILTLRKVISIRILSMRIISAIMNFYWSRVIALQKQSNERSYKFSGILTLTEVISILILRKRLISTIMNLYWSHTIALQKLYNNERSYKFSWILTLTEVISIRNLRFFDRQRKWRPHPRSQGFLPSHTDWAVKPALSEGKSALWSRMMASTDNSLTERHIKKLFATTTDDRWNSVPILTVVS